MLVHIKKLVKGAQQGRYALAAMNTSNLEVTLGIIRAAAAKKSPIIIQCSESTIEYSGVDIIAQLVKIVADTEGKSIPIALHLDHGHSLKMVKECLRAGFSSVHLDASSLPFEENIAKTREAARYAHKLGAYAQGELGAMLGKEGMTKLKVPKNADEYMTDPDKAKEFVKRSEIDTLAVSVGTLHGFFPGKEKLDAKRLQAISQAVKGLPLVLHGSSGLPENQIKESIRLGVRIINVDTDIRMAFIESLRKTIKVTPRNFHDPRKILGPSIDAVAEETKIKIDWCGSGKKK